MNADRHFFPREDASYDAWLAQFVSRMPGVIAQLGLPPSFDDSIAALQAEYSSRLAEHISRRNKAQAARRAKEEIKADSTREMRKLVLQLRAHPGFDDTQAAQLGLPIYDRTRTPKRPQQERPMIKALPQGPQKHGIRVWRQLDSLARRARPPWARGARIVRAIVEVGGRLPGGDQMQFVGVATAGRLEVLYDGEHVGKEVWYRAAWETPTGALGPWSDPAKCMVMG